MCTHLLEAGAAEINLSRNALDRSFGMQLEGKPRHVHEMLTLELLDSDRVDVAPRSNVVGKDDQLNRRIQLVPSLTPLCAKLIATSQLSLTRGWQNGARFDSQRLG